MYWLALLLCFGQADDRAEVLELLRVGRQRDAREIMTRLLEQDATDQGLRRDLVQLEMRIGRYAAALAHCEGLGAEFDATRGTALYLLGRYEEALEFLGEDKAETILYRHEALLALARFEAADKTLDRAAVLLGEDDTEVRVRRGQAFARAGEFEQAARLFQSVLDENPVSPAALYGLGQIWVQSDQEEAGLVLLERHRVLLPLLDQLDFARQNLELDASHAPNHAALGDALRVLCAFDPGKIAEAQVSYEIATTLAKGSEVAPIALRHARFLEEVLQDAAHAVQVLDQAFTAEPDARLAVRAGDMLLRVGQPKEALTRYERALALRPQDEVIAQRIASARAAVATDSRKAETLK